MYYCYILLLINLCYGILADDRPIAKTNNGLIRGIYKTSINGREFSAFEGIPYAEAPIGNRRFREPEPKSPWMGIWDASTTYTCLQNDHSPTHFELIIGTEDCLYLNVYSPNVNKTNGPMNVIIHIHGGAFMFGGSSYWGPERLMDYNIIYVNLNYRLGPLGFLSTEDDVLPGNNGLKDQSLALKWIKENIHHFGGNPESITLTGLSAGGASVHFHYMSPLSKGLFHRGISISGTALCNWALVEHPLKKAKKLGALVGCEENSSQELVDCLRQRSGKQIVKTIKEFQPWLYNPYSPFGPVVEPKSTTKKGKSFLPDLPYNLLKNGQIADADWITSVTSDEGLYPAAEFLYKENYLDELEKSSETLFPYIMHYDGTVAKESQKEIAQKIKEYYLHGKKITKETFPEIIQAIGDRLFVIDAEKAARLQAKVNKSPVYFYKFSYRGDHSLSEYYSKNVDNVGVSHADDVMYVTQVNSDWFTKYLVSDEDKKVSKILINMWLSYANNGKPEMNGLEWPQVSKNLNDKIKYVHFKSADEIVVEEAEEMGHRSFWDSLPIKENNLIYSSKDEL